MPKGRHGNNKNDKNQRKQHSSSQPKHKTSGSANGSNDYH